MDWLAREATLFRSALEVADFDTRDGNLDHFPTNCCHHACNLFAIHLLELGHGPSMRVSGHRPGDRTLEHVWLVHQGWIVDLTADQFLGEGQPPVFVSPTSNWHSSWHRSPARDRLLDREWSGWMRQEWYDERYQKVLRALNQ